MRLFEIESIDTVEVSQRFISELNALVEVNPAIKDRLINFIKAKMSDTILKGEGGFQAVTTKGVKHYHLLKGDVIIIYRRIGTVLRIYFLVPHKAYDNTGINRISDNIKQLDANEKFVPFDYKTLEKPVEIETISEEQYQEIIILIWQLVAEGKDYIIDAALKNQWVPFFSWIHTSLPDIKYEAVFAKFGGAPALQEVIKTALKQIRRK